MEVVVACKIAIYAEMCVYVRVRTNLKGKQKILTIERISDMIANPLKSLDKYLISVSVEPEKSSQIHFRNPSRFFHSC